MTSRHLPAVIALFILLEIMLVGFADQPLCLRLHLFGVNHPAVTAIFRFYTDAGLGKWYAWSSAMGGLLCAGLYRLPRLAGYRARLKSWGWTCGYFFATTSAAGLLADLLKPIIGRARPKLLLEHDIYGFHPFYFNGSWNSMPSGHTATAFAVAFTMSRLFHRHPAQIYWYAIAIALSRIMIDAHFLSDVLAGAATGLLGAWGVTWFFRRRHWLQNTIMGNFPPTLESKPAVDRKLPIT